jgi:hypothetical protein
MAYMRSTETAWEAAAAALLAHRLSSAASFPDDPN